MSSSRYVARVSIERVHESAGTGRGDDRRTKAIIANIVVGSTDLESLKKKAAAHLDLVEDGGDIEERITR